MRRTRPFQSSSTPEPRPLRGRRKHKPSFDLRGQLYRITGVDLTEIDGVDVQTAQTVLSEVGVDMSRWKSEKQFASWLGLCPDPAQLPEAMTSNTAGPLAGRLG